MTAAASARMIVDVRIFDVCMCLRETAGVDFLESCDCQSRLKDVCVKGEDDYG